jgi:hypothetical protein
MEIGNLLVQLKEDPELWEAADAILENAEDPNTKFLALQLLEKAIQVIILLKMIDKSQFLE